MKASDFFSPHQLGVACPYGVEKIVHGLRICIEEHVNDNDFVVMKIDLQNAFNLVSRQARQAPLDKCRARFSELFQWAVGCYGDHPLLLSAMGTLRLESGVQQGDPLGPLLFCLVLHKVVTATQFAHSIHFTPGTWMMGSLLGQNRQLYKHSALLNSLILHWVSLSILPNVSKGGLRGFPDEVKKSNALTLKSVGLQMETQPFVPSPLRRKEQMPLCFWHC